MRSSFTSRKALTALSLLLGLALVSTQTIAADKASAPAGSIKVEKLAKQPQQIGPTMLEVTVDKGVPLTLSSPAASIFVANPDVADVQVMTPSSILVFGKKAGQTTLVVSGDNGKILTHRNVMVTQNLADLREALRTVLPESNIKLEPVPNGVVLSGEAKDAASLEDARRLAARYIPKENGEIINRIKVKANNQIQIRVRFAEVSREVDKRFGINWENVISTGAFTFGLAQGADVITSAGVFNRPVTGNDTNNVFNASYNSGNVNVNGMIDALAKDGFVTILAEPSLTALSGETASFLAGGEFPIPVPQSADTITIEWKQYGVSLAFTPTILGNDRINLHVRPEVSQLTDAGSITLSNIVVPALSTRRAETTLELGSGQSFAIAGLLNNNQSQAVSKFPFLGDVPVLGPLFRSTRFQNNESELVIIITPYIVKPGTEESLALPTDGFAPPTDMDRLWKMRQSNSDPNARPISGDARAVKIDKPIQPIEAPVPVAVPVTNVIPPAEERAKPLPPSPEPAQEPKQTPMKQSLPLATSKTKIISPSGPGGFIVE